MPNYPNGGHEYLNYAIIFNMVCRDKCHSYEKSTYLRYHLIRITERYLKRVIFTTEEENKQQVEVSSNLPFTLTV